jgi:SpoVK/Ycf46/Vps4 family AAA+-type ATPase
MDKIQSKWVGESEKNAKAIFDEIEKCSKFLGKDVIAVFNEADAVIGKRMEANSSVDKSFNTLTNIFLQAFEDYKGIAILTTNLANHFDEAFMRRILFRIQFHKPEVGVRKKILMNVFSNLSDTMIDKINEDFEFTGAQIANVRKKILIKEILEEEDHNEEYIFKLCQEEQVLTKTKRANIGFIQ